MADLTARSWLNNEPRIFTEYIFHETGEAEVKAEINRYYQAAASGN